MSKRRYILAALLGGLISQSALAAHGRLGDDAPRLREMERMERPTPAQSRRMTPSEAAAQAQRIHGGGRVLSVEPAGEGYRVKLLQHGDVNIVTIPAE